MNIDAKINLSDLAKSKQSATRRLEMLLPEIEAYLAQGVRQKDVVSLLNSQGFNITPDYFKIMLKRIRKRNPKPKLEEEKNIAVQSLTNVEAPVNSNDVLSKTNESEKRRRIPIVQDQPVKKVFKFDPHSPVKW